MKNYGKKTSHKTSLPKGKGEKNKGQSKRPLQEIGMILIILISVAFIPFIPSIIGLGYRMIINRRGRIYEEETDTYRSILAY